MIEAVHPKHDLAEYVEEVQLTLQKDYETIRKRVREDPGTAGDQAEETWAGVLRKWLPGHYHVVTKGRIVGSKGGASKQIDLLVLWPTYPPFLLDKKMYLASGVAAAFECKLTLKLSHLRKIFENSVILGEVTETEYNERRYAARAARMNFSYEEYHRIFEFGVLAHAFECPQARDAAATISEEIRKLDIQIVQHPRDMIDLVCVQTVGSWVSERCAVTEYRIPEESNKNMIRTGYFPYPLTGYHCMSEKTWVSGSGHHSNFSPLGSFISRMYHKLSRNDQTLVPLANFFKHALSTGIGGGGPGRSWRHLPTPPEIISAVESRRRNKYLYGHYLDEFAFLGF